MSRNPHSPFPRWPAIASLALTALLTASLSQAAPAGAGEDVAWRQRLPAAERALYDRLCARLEAAYDPERGYVSKDGMPSEAAIEVALWNGLSEPDGYWSAHADRTMRWTLTLYDSVRAGFFHGVSDAEVGSSDYSKRTDSNARRFELLALSWRLTGNDGHLRHARDVYGYFQRVLAEGRAGFVWGQVGDRQLYPEPNGHAVRAYLGWAALTKDPRPRDYALKSLDATCGLTWRPMGGFWKRNFLEDLPKGVALSDQIAMGRGIVMAARVAGRPEDEQRAIAVGELVLKWFGNAEDGFFHSTATPKKDGNVKGSGRDALDNARAVLFLAELTHLTGDPKWAAAARRAIPAFEKDFDDMKLEAADWALAVRTLSVSDLPARPEWAPVVENAPKEPVRARSKRYRTGGQ